MTETKASRLFYLDNLRVALIAGVIAHHAGQAYGPTGGTWPIMEATRAAILGPFFTVNRSFAMSLFFFVSGYFTVISCDAKGPAAFLKSRLLRLGIPVLVVALVAMLLQVFVFAPKGQHGSPWPVDVGPLWFIEHLLIFGAAYALWRMFSGRDLTPNRTPANPPGYLAALLFALALAALSGAVRFWYPIDRWSNVLGFIRVAYADVPRDLGLFVLGLLAGHGRWLERVPERTGRNWLLVGLSAAVLWYVYDLLLKHMLPMSPIALGAIYAVWEELLCLGLCIGLVVFFRERLNFSGRLSRALAKSQYAAFIFHMPIVVGLQAAALKTHWPPFAKFVLVTILAIPATFLVSNWLRKWLHL